MNNARKLLAIVIFSALICSMVELYFFLVLPLHVIRNGDFKEGMTHWSILAYSGNESFRITLNTTNDFHGGVSYRAKLTFTGNTTHSLSNGDVWVKVFQNVPTHPFTETTTVSFRLFIAQPDLELLMSQSDAIFIYTGFMLGNQTEKHFCVYGWIIKDSGKIKMTNEPFRELKYWTILDLKEEEVNLTEEFELFFEKNVWSDVVGKGMQIDSSWQIEEGAELGFMIWNLCLNETQTLTVKLNHFDITYIWPALRLTSKPENTSP
jgi:hypothetical protein